MARHAARHRVDRVRDLDALRLEQVGERTYVVLQPTINPGFAGIENPLFFNPKTVMLFGDAKESIGKLIEDVKGL